MRLKLSLFLFTLFLMNGLYAQMSIKGKVFSSEDKEPVIGASVKVKGSSTGTITNVEGVFELKIPEGGKFLTISYVGMKSKEVPVKNNLTIFMESLTQDMQEVIVVAYGTAKKSSFTGSASNFGKDKIEKLQVSEISKALEGAIAGVQISSSSGQPGSSAAIRVRGVGSMLASSSPLIVLDGVPYEGALNTINPQDVESMSVLKDAAANSLYGARGANGVIMVTTKKGRAGKVVISLDNRTGFNFKGIQSYDVLSSPKEYYELYWETLRNQQLYSVNNNALASGQYASKELVTALGGYNAYSGANADLVNPLTGRLNPDARLLYRENWLNEAFSPGLRQENNINMGGGDAKTTYYLSLGYLSDDSYTAQSNLTRYSLRLKVDQQVSDALKVGANLAVSTSDSNVPSVGGTSSSSIFYTGQTIAPIYPVYRRDSSGNPILGPKGERLYDYGITEGHSRPIAANSNPIDQQANNIREGHNDAINAKLYAQVKFLKDFMFTANLSVDNFNSNSIDFQTPIGGDALNVNGRGTKSFSRAMTINSNQLLNWNKSIDKNNFEALLGHESKKDITSYLSAMKENFFLPDNPELDNAVNLTNASSAKETYSLEGYFSQLKYNYADKYYLSGSFRLDGSSRFHESARWGKFWSVGGAWRMNAEPFLASCNYINDLKLKASFGTQGNDNLGNALPYGDQYVVRPQNGQPGLTHVFRGNQNLTWEKSNNFNVGFDFKLWNRLSGVVEYFYKETWDLLYAKPLPPSQGSPTSIWENTMRMSNKGVEAELSYNLISKRDLNWVISLNMTHYRNALKELPADRNQNGWANGNKFLRKGESIYNMYGFKFAGVDPLNGDPLYYANTVDDKGNITGTHTVNKTEQATRYEYGKTSIPDLYGGLNNSINFKNFDLNISLAFQLGGWAYDSQYAGFMHGGNAGSNWHKDIYKRWTPENPNTNIPRLEAGFMDINAESERFLVSASYLSLRNVSLGYTLPTSLLSRMNIQNIRVFATGDNLFLLSARRGFDPRQSFSGASGYSYSAVTTCSLGFNITF